MKQKLIVTTTDFVEGYRVVEYLGIVDAMAGCGGDCDPVYKNMLQRARELGADAVLGVRYVVTGGERGSAWVVMNGTAVRLERINRAATAVSVESSRPQSRSV